MIRHSPHYFIFLIFLTIGVLFGLLPINSTHPAAAAQIETATPLPDPLSSPLPDPRPVPVSAWRPPLFPVPWALNENDHFYFSRPIAANKVNWPLSAYRYAGTNFGADTPHTGVDIVADLGTPVLASAAGKVVWTGYGLFYGYEDLNDPYGLSIAIAHDFGYQEEPLYTVYAHLSNIIVEKGQEVEAGEIIGAVGETGLVTAPHLHFEVRWGANTFFDTYNPELWLAPPQGWGVLAGKITTTWSELVPLHQVRITNLNTNERWYGNSYGTTTKTINRDPYYNENFVHSDLPAGTYEIMIAYAGREYKDTIQIYPGAVSFFWFRGKWGFRDVALTPAIPGNLPIYATNTPEP